MKTQNKIRNIGILAHVDAGKTTITEHMLFESGKIRVMGSVDRGTAYTDYMDIERQRGISVRSASTSFIWKGVNINLIDTPGHVDFCAEVERSLSIMDCAVLVLSAVEGVQAQAEVLWKALKAMHIPAVLFINKIDRIGADSGRVLEEIRRVLSPGVVPMQQVTGEGTGEPKVLDGLGNVSIPEIKNWIMECLADKDDGILERYLNGQEISNNILRKKLSELTKKCEIYPVFYGSALKGIGIKELMDAIIEYLPCPAGDADSAFSGVVFRIDHDENMGRIAHVRLYNGRIRPRDTVMNVTSNVEEKVTQVRRINVQKYEDIGEASAGEIAALCGLNSTRIGDILGSMNGVPQGYHFSNPFLKVRVYPEDDRDYPRLVDALMRLSDADPMLDAEWIQERRELFIKIMGLIQMEVLSSILRESYGLNVTFSKASVIYKETPSSSGEGFISYTMPKPCWAVLRFLIEPGERGSGVSYSSTVRTEYILERYQKQVEKTVPKSLEQGIYGWEVTDIRITLIGGEYHVEHTHPPDFAVATPMGIMDGLRNTGTNLLEPVLDFTITAPEDAGGRILNDLIQMRAAFESPVIINGKFTVKGTVPGAASMDYHIRLASMTGGRGTISTAFAGYSECALENGAVCPRRGPDPLDTAKYILYARNAMSGE